MRTWRLTASAALAIAFATWAGACDTPPSANDHRDPATWLCRPSHNAFCSVDLDTVVAADGTLTARRFRPGPAPPVDWVVALVERQSAAFARSTATR